EPGATGRLSSGEMSCRTWLPETGTALLVVRPPAVTAALVLDRALHLPGAQHAALLQVDPLTGRLQFTHLAGQPGPTLQDLIALRPGETAAERSMSQRAPVCQDDLLHDAGLRPDLAGALKRLGLRRVLAAPLLHDGATSG